MTTEEANEYLANLKGKQSEESKEPVNQEISEEVKAAPASNSDKEIGEEPKTETPAETKGDDKPKEEVVETKSEVKDKDNQRDYAFIREKKKRKEQKEKYEARIKELEDIISKQSGLKPEHFKDDQGNIKTDEYVNWKFKERDMQDEIKHIKQMDKEEQLKYDLEEDARRVASCYPDDKERKEYEDLIAKNGAAFYEAVTEVDKDQVVFNYLSTMPEYPIVMKELMTNNAVLSRLFRSTDKDSLKKNIEKIADEIIEKHHAKPDKPVEQKPSIPVIGKQISNNTSSVPAVKDSTYWNNYLRQHPRG